MHTAKKWLVGMFSACLSFFLNLFIYINFENFSFFPKFFIIIIFGMIAGAVQGFLIARHLHRFIGIGTFVGIFSLFIPVIIATYGFALVGIPFLIGFSALVLSGTRFGARLRDDFRRRK